MSLFAMLNEMITDPFDLFRLRPYPRNNTSLPAPPAMMQMPAIGFSVVGGTDVSDAAPVEAEPATFIAGEEVMWSGVLGAGPHTLCLQTFQPRVNGQFTATIFTDSQAREL